MPSLSRSDRPTVLVAGRPAWASESRSWSTSLAGTRIVDPLSASWYGTLSEVSLVVTLAASDGWRLVNSGM